MRNRQALLCTLCLVALFSEAWRGLSSLGFSAPPRADPYAILGLAPGTNGEVEVKNAFRRLAKVYHPDVPGTGDITKFQELQLAAKQLLTGQAPGSSWDATSLESLFSSSPQHMYAAASQRPPSTAHVPLQQSDFAGTRTGRVDVPHCVSRRSSGLRKAARLQTLTHEATPETVVKVQNVLAQVLGGSPEPQAPLAGVGFILEGHTCSIGEQQVAEAAMALEEEFGVELLTILAGTWINFPMPAQVRTVKDLADFIESKLMA
eukprot:TRINITY_DN9123_c0_g1_i2.p1 TRINITY_DN9123_c0_g1~~TRINITY_DN9123_c0_g1_i2.p1  ORF type:complete len:262 (+),score=52.55 TRINITY_DN9123_c0_g1_i2:41-826(+)